ncbi:probable proteasome assembly chaperone 3 [Coccomyxa sp. Obi]|nr:probable proteasome assembly chaperone 3 [Coccomyxa sp. Obi]
MAPTFPVNTREFTAEVDGISTSFIMSAYADRIMVVVTQLGTFGTVLLSRADGLLEGKQTFTVDTLLGKRDEPALIVCARHMAESIMTVGCNRPLLLCLGLKQHSFDSMRTIIKEVLAHPVW